MRGRRQQQRRHRARDREAERLLGVLVLPAVLLLCTAHLASYGW